MSKHTPGPWNLYPNNASDWVVRKMFPNGQESHEIARCQSGMDNARLIAAAPDLLEALQAMLEQFTKTPSTLKDSEARCKAHAAIAKAMGEES